MGIPEIEKVLSENHWLTSTDISQLTGYNRQSTCRVLRGMRRFQMVNFKVNKCVYYYQKK